MSSAATIPSAISQPSSPSEGTQTLGDARLSFIQGDVAIQTTNTGDEWGAAAVNTPLIPGMKIWDPERGRSEIQFFDDSYLRGSGNTEVDVTNLSMGSEGDVIQVGLPQGRSYISYARSEVQNSVFQVDTPIASIMAYGASKFQVDVYNDGSTEISVLRGSVYVQAQNGRTQVNAGTMLSIDSNQNAELSAMRPEDAWLNWNLSRDSLMARNGSSRDYLPDSLDVYSNDFDAYGHWVDTADYGYVWTPIGVAVDWAPYRVGRWCWIGGDYVWVSYEPWGWAPYHYGRWAFIRNTGWCWVPPPPTGVYWGPGFVAWIDTPTYVSWVPLAPRETYYGYGYYGPWSMDIRKVNLNRINITNNYVNAQVANAVTVVGRQAFLTGRPERISNVPRNPFKERVKVSAGRPQITPVKATALPDPSKTVSRNLLPSGQVLTKAARVEHRPVALHKDVSVFHSGRQVSSMHIARVEHPRPIATVQKGQAPIKGKEIGPQRGKTSGPSAPSTHREFGIAPQHQGQPGPPSVQRKELKPPAQASKPAPPVQRKETVTKPSQKGQATRPFVPSTHREFGVAPQHQGLSNPPPVQREELNPPPQVSRPVPPATQREFGPPAQMSRPAPPAPKVPPANGPAVQRNMGVAPPHAGQPNAHRLPQAVPPPNVNKKDKR